MIAIIDYGMGNLGSIANMLKKIGVNGIVTSDVHEIRAAERLILPGVGAFDNGMKNLQERNLIGLLDQKVLKEQTPILGLCLGMQLFAERSEEGNCAGLGWLKADVVRFRFDPSRAGLKIPHMGWNTVEINSVNGLFSGLVEDARFYFVHSYHVVCIDPTLTLGESEYGYRFSSVINKSNIYGVQFHPEKSHKYGMRLLKNFAELD